MKEWISNNFGTEGGDAKSITRAVWEVIAGLSLLGLMISEVLVN